jgi:hypothetical protein
LGLEFDIFFQIRYIDDAGFEEFDILEVEMGFCRQDNVIVVDVDKDSLDLDGGARERDNQESRCKAKVAQGDWPEARIDPRSAVDRNPSPYLYLYHLGHLSSHPIEVAWKTSRIPPILLFQYPHLVDIDIPIPHEQGNQMTPID